MGEIAFPGPGTAMAFAAAVAAGASAYASQSQYPLLISGVLAVLAVVLALFTLWIEYISGPVREDLSHQLKKLHKLKKKKIISEKDFEKAKEKLLNIQKMIKN